MLSDEQLVGGGISADDADKIAELISRYSNLVFAMAGRFTQYADYEELVSDGLDALLGAVKTFEVSRGSFAAYASVCISNRMRNTSDKARRRVLRLADVSELEQLD